MNQEKSTVNSNTWYIIGGVLLVIIIVLIVVFTGKSSNDIDEFQVRQEQLENDPKLAENVNSPRNNFNPGNYKINDSQSFIKWTYGESSGTIPINSGRLMVLDKGRIGEFSAGGDASKTTVDKGNNSEVKNFITSNGKDVAMNALTILPNTNDDAFTVAFTLDALGKKTSLATGMFVEKTEKGIKVSGDIYVDAKTVINTNGFPNATDNLKLTVNYIFE